MNESAATSQLDRELRELRARAYGPHPDIQDDPEALARLDELESARLSAHRPAPVGEQAAQGPAPLPPDTAVGDGARQPGAVLEGAGESAEPGSVWQKLPTTRAARVWLIVGCAVAILGASFAATWFAAPDAEATLQPTGIAADDVIRAAVSWAPLAEVDKSTLRGYEPYRGLTPWLADGAQGSRCLIVVEASTLWGLRCAPPEAELIFDIGVFPPDYAGTYTEGLADGTVIRFQVRGDSVDVYLYPPPSAD